MSKSFKSPHNHLKLSSKCSKQHKQSEKIEIKQRFNPKCEQSIIILSKCLIGTKVWKIERIKHDFLKFEIFIQELQSLSSQQSKETLQSEF